MATVEYSAALEVDAARTWETLRRFGDIAEWHPAIVRSGIEEAPTDELTGAVRRLELADGGILRERLLALDDRARTLSYRFGESPLPLDNYRAQINVIEAAAGSACIVEWRATFDVRDPETQAHYEALISGLIKDGHQSLAAFLRT